MPHSRWMIPESWWDVLMFYSLSMALGVSGIEEKTDVTTVIICGYVRIGVCGCVWVVVLGVLL